MRWVDLSRQGVYLSEVNDRLFQKRLVLLDRHQQGDPALLKEAGFIPLASVRIEGERHTKFDIEHGSNYYLKEEGSKFYPNQVAKAFGIEKCPVVELSLEEIRAQFEEQSQEVNLANRQAFLDSARRLVCFDDRLSLIEREQKRYLVHEGGGLWDVVEEGDPKADGYLAYLQEKHWDLNESSLFLHAKDVESLRQCAGVVIDALMGEPDRYDWHDVSLVARDLYAGTASQPDQAATQALVDQLHLAFQQSLLKFNADRDRACFIELPRVEAWLARAEVSQRQVTEGANEKASARGMSAMLLWAAQRLLSGRLGVKRPDCVQTSEQYEIRSRSTGLETWLPISAGSVMPQHLIVRVSAQSLKTARVLDTEDQASGYEAIMDALEARQSHGCSVLVLESDIPDAAGALSIRSKQLLSHLHDAYQVESVVELAEGLGSPDGATRRFRLVVLGDQRRQVIRAQDVPHQLPVLADADALWVWVDDVLANRLRHEQMHKAQFLRDEVLGVQDDDEPALLG